MATIDLNQNQIVIFSEIWDEVLPILESLQNEFGIDSVVDIKMRWLKPISLNAHELYIWSNGSTNAPNDYRENAYQKLVPYHNQFSKIWEKIKSSVDENFKIKMVTFMPKGGPLFNNCGILCETEDDTSVIRYISNQK